MPQPERRRFLRHDLRRRADYPANKLNEWGDYFAGFFAPLAFLWLVISYFQQGEGLKNSVKELGQQTELNRQAIELNRQAIQEDRERRRPKFIVTPLEMTARSVYRLEIMNIGSAATHVRMNFKDPEQCQCIDPSHGNIGTMDQYMQKEVKLQLIPPDSSSSTVTISCIDKDGCPDKLQFDIAPSKDDRGKLTVGSIKRVARK